MKNKSIEEFTKTTPVNPPTVNKNTNPKTQRDRSIFVLFGLWTKHEKI